MPRSRGIKTIFENGRLWNIGLAEPAFYSNYARTRQET